MSEPPAKKVCSENNGSAEPFLMLIDGKTVVGNGDPFAVLNPATEEVLAYGTVVALVMLVMIARVCHFNVCPCHRQRSAPEQLLSRERAVSARTSIPPSMRSLSER